MKKYIKTALTSLGILLSLTACGVFQGDGAITDHRFVLDQPGEKNSEVVLNFYEDKTFAIKDLKNDKEWSGQYAIERVNPDYKLDLLYTDEDQQIEILGAYGIVQYHDGSKDYSVTLSTDDQVLYFVAEDEES